MLRGRAEQIAKAAERMGPNRLLLVRADPDQVGALGGEHVEVIEPEVRHYLLQLARTLERSHQARPHRLLEDHHPPLLRRSDARIGFDSRGRIAAARGVPLRERFARLI